MKNLFIRKVKEAVEANTNSEIFEAKKELEFYNFGYSYENLNKTFKDILKSYKDNYDMLEDFELVDVKIFLEEKYNNMNFSVEYKFNSIEKNISYFFYEYFSEYIFKDLFKDNKIFFSEFIKENFHIELNMTDANKYYFIAEKSKIISYDEILEYFEEEEEEEEEDDDE